MPSLQPGAVSLPAGQPHPAPPAGCCLSPGHPFICPLAFSVLAATSALVLKTPHQEKVAAESGPSLGTAGYRAALAGPRWGAWPDPLATSRLSLGLRPQLPVPQPFNPQGTPPTPPTPAPSSFAVTSASML